MTKPPEDKRYPKQTHLLKHTLELVLVAAYVAVGIARRAGFVWIDSPLAEYRGGAILGMLAGVAQDLGASILLLGLFGWAGRKAFVGIAALLCIATILSSINLSVLAALNVPFDLSMLSYLGDPFRSVHLESPVPLGHAFSWALGLGLCCATAGFFTHRRHQRRGTVALQRTWSSSLTVILAAFALLGAAQATASLDHRAQQLAAADGFSWAWFQFRGARFQTPPEVARREAILTAASHASERFVDANYPLLRGTPYVLCRWGAAKRAECAKDHDGDGFPLTNDCNDQAPQIHPGAHDAPGDGIDADCSGLDAEPPDVLVIEFEGLPARVLSETGGEPVAKELSALAHRKDARLFTRYETAAIQTSPGFASAMCSLIPHFGANITRSFPTLELRCLPEVLKEQGFQTQMVQNGDPAFDAQGAFAEKIGFQHVEGFQAILKALPASQMLTRWGVADEHLFSYLAALLAQRSTKTPPLFLLAQTITNHHPYIIPGRPAPEGAGTWEKLRHTSTYVDHAFGTFVKTIDALARQPGRRPLLVVMSGDHGHASEQHLGNRMPASALYEENVHTPLLWWSPGHPERLLPLDISPKGAPCSSIDLMPTLMGMLGIQTLHASMGRSLTIPSQERDQRAIAMNPMAGGLVRVTRSARSVIARALPPRVEVYAEQDPHELRPLPLSPGTAESQAWEAANEAVSAVMAARALIRENRIWNPELLPKPGRQALLGIGR
ncbi:MAG: sulfatase-like hydrolase/transferase [Polyangiaceae bacterium]|nr:sulfatase-like hydrolase/transferase [Polyangiaceae bacterium]